MILAAQNYRGQDDILRWEMLAADFRGAQAQTLGELSVPAGQRVEHRIPLPAHWRGHISVHLEATSSTQQFSLSATAGVIPHPQRRFREGSPFGIQPEHCVIRDDRLLDLMEWMGAHWLRVGGLPASGQAEGLPEWTEVQAFLRKLHARGLEPTPSNVFARSDLADYFAFCRGRVRLHEMANELNIHMQAAEYAELQKRVYVLAKQADPDCWVGTTGLSGVDITWLEDLAANGGWDYLDVLILHPYSFPYAPEVGPQQSDYWWLVPRLAELRALMDRYGEKPVFDSEHGYLSLDPQCRIEGYPLNMVVPERAVAALLVRNCLWEVSYGVSGIEWFVLNKYGGFELLNHDYTPRPAYCAYAVMTRELDGAEYVGNLPAAEDPRVQRMVFRDVRGKPVVVAWATIRQSDVVNEHPGTPAWEGQEPGQDRAWDGRPWRDDMPLSVIDRIRVGVTEVRVTDLMGYESVVPCPEGWLSVELTEDPVYIHGAHEALLDEAARHCARLFVSEPVPTAWSPVIQVLLPPGGSFLPRSGVSDTRNISARLISQQASELAVRITNLSREMVTGDARLLVPQGWLVQPVTRGFEAGPGQMVQVFFQVTPAEPAERCTLRSRVTCPAFSVADSVLHVSAEPG